MLLFSSYYWFDARFVLLAFFLSDAFFIALATRKLRAKPFLLAFPLTFVDYLMFELTWNHLEVLLFALSIVNCLVLALLKPPRKSLTVAFLFLIDVPICVVPLLMTLGGDRFYYDGSKWHWLEYTPLIFSDGRGITWAAGGLILGTIAVVCYRQHQEKTT